MSHSRLNSRSSPALELKSQIDIPDAQECDLEHVTKRTNLARISEINSGLRFAECEEEIEDELLEASLEKYQ
jgi:hypothetical protein